MIFSIALTTAFVATVLAAPLSWCEMGGKVVDCDRMAEGEQFYLTYGPLPALITFNLKTLKFAARCEVENRYC